MIVIRVDSPNLLDAFDYPVSLLCEFEAALEANPDECPTHFVLSNSRKTLNPLPIAALQGDVAQKLQAERRRLMRLHW